MAVAEVGGRANLRSGSGPRLRFSPVRSLNICGSAALVSLVPPASDQHGLRVDCVNNLRLIPGHSRANDNQNVGLPDINSRMALEDILRETFMALDRTIPVAHDPHNPFLDELNLPLLP